MNSLNNRAIVVGRRTHMFQREAKIFTEVGGRVEAKDITERGSEINRDIRGEINSRLARAHLLAFLFPS